MAIETMYVSVLGHFLRAFEKKHPQMAHLPMLHLNADNMLTMTPHNKMV